MDEIRSLSISISVSIYLECQLKAGKVYRHLDLARSKNEIKKYEKHF